MHLTGLSKVKMKNMDTPPPIKNNIKQKKSQNKNKNKKPDLSVKNLYELSA
jgi:hypothetical protein